MLGALLRDLQADLRTIGEILNFPCHMTGNSHELYKGNGSEIGAAVLSAASSILKCTTQSRGAAQVR